jgi:hypothetical protein
LHAHWYEQQKILEHAQQIRVSLSFFHSLSRSFIIKDPSISISMSNPSSSLSQSLAKAQPMLPPSNAPVADPPPETQTTPNGLETPSNQLLAASASTKTPSSTPAASKDPSNTNALSSADTPMPDAPPANLSSLPSHASPAPSKSTPASSPNSQSSVTNNSTPKSPLNQSQPPSTDEPASKTPTVESLTTENPPDSTDASDSSGFGSDDYDYEALGPKIKGGDKLPTPEQLLNIGSENVVEFLQVHALFFFQIPQKFAKIIRKPSKFLQIPFFFFSHIFEIKTF